MASLHHEAFACQETDPGASVAIFAHGRAEATSLSRAVVGFVLRRLAAQCASHPLPRISSELPVAVELMVRISTAPGRSHQSRLSILTNVLYTYINIDPLGYADEIERGFAHLDAAIPTGPHSDRFVLNHRRVSYLVATERWDEAYDLSLLAFALADQAASKHP